MALIIYVDYNHNRFSKSIISLKWFHLGIFFALSIKIVTVSRNYEKKILKLNHLREIIDLDNQL